MWKFISRLQRKRQQIEQDLDRELRYHLDRREQDLIKSGLSGSEARRRAAIEFGGLAQAQEDVRDTRLPRWFQDLVRDIQYACRTLRKNLGFTSVAEYPWHWALVRIRLSSGSSTQSWFDRFLTMIQAAFCG